MVKLLNKSNSRSKNITCKSRSRTCNNKSRSRTCNNTCKSRVVCAKIHLVRGVVHSMILVSRRVVHAIISYNEFKAFYCQYVTPIWSL